MKEFFQAADVNRLSVIECCILNETLWNEKQPQIVRLRPLRGATLRMTAVHDFCSTQ
jgi:hypothetical protein